MSGKGFFSRAWWGDSPGSDPGPKAARAPGISGQQGGVIGVSAQGWAIPVGLPRGKALGVQRQNV